MLESIRRILGKILLGIVLAYGALFGISFYLAPDTALAEADAIVVLSGDSTQSRTEKGIELYQDGWAPKVIFSGAAAEGPSNAQSMRQLALEAGVPDEDIILEENATDTLENAGLTLDILQQRNWSKIILVTSPYHQRRAFLSFEHQSDLADYDLEIINEPSDSPRWNANGWWNDDWARNITFSEVQKVIYLRFLRVSSSDSDQTAVLIDGTTH